MAQHRAPRKHTGTWIVIAILLAAAVIGTLWVPFYNHLTPTFAGFPFFYWYQLMWVPIVAILAAALIGTLWVPFYNHLTPKLGDFPFFYWYQLMWVPIVAILSAAAYLLSRLARRGNAAASKDRGEMS